MNSFVLYAIVSLFSPGGDMGGGNNPMVLSIEEISELRSRIRSALASGRLNAWQARFLTDMQQRLETYGPQVRLSVKQLSKLREIVGTGTSPGRVVQPVRPSRSRRRRRGGVLAREGRWFARRLMRDVSLLAAILVAVSIASYLRETPWQTVSSFFSAAAPSYSTVSITRDQFSVTDGDTIRMAGDRKGTRLVGFNTPESIEPRCEEERTLGLRAKARLKELVANGSLELRRMPCSCDPGTEGTEACNYGRSCAILRIDGRDVGQILISEGLAVSFRCGTTSCPPTPRPWCS
ncbi:thermonuclease family protein [Mesorhizobium sp. L-8-3]|uniref:thermonuclease family protein n=1 Tax=Mesorhizobium sp. L-8-3 TaxID=2744522 RepID=UPI001934CB4C|nr:thermonuclease family protein [Mesorhizobium sp. L-8-3]BCH23534.1 membrane protein [Mesorhizobium sp. L-8-3]